MRWRTPKRGDTRVRSGFLWLPLCADGEWRWLERARWVELHYVGTRSARWLPREWLDNETMEVGRG